MNYNTNMFVISVGEHLSAISYNAPWMNNQPITHGQAYMILCAIHEELVNEIFSWAKIDNSLQEAMTKVYYGFSVLVPAEPRIWKWNGREWGVQPTATTQQFPVDIRPGQGLPRDPVTGTAYRVHGGLRYDDCFQFFIDNTLAYVRWSLRNELNKYLATSREYEWYFEYNSNGIVYNREKEAAKPRMIDCTPQTEPEQINEEIQYMAKPDIAGMTLVIDLAKNESRGGTDRVTGETTPDRFGALMNGLPQMLNELYQCVLQAGSNRADVLIRYTNPTFLREVCDFITEYTRNCPIRHVVRTEQIKFERLNAMHSLDRALQERSITEMNRQQDELAKSLSAVRERIVRRNNVQDVDIREIESLSPGLLRTAVLSEDAYVSVNNRDHWYKFAEHNPAELQQPVIGLCLLLSNHIDALTGNSPVSKQPTPMFEPRNIDETTLIGVTPLYCR